MAKYLTCSSIISLLATVSAVLGRGVMPAGQARTITFTATGFTLPVAMAYTELPTVPVKSPTIATSEAGAKAFVERLVMQTVFNVLESQGRKALLPNAVISTIFGQLSVWTNYKPMRYNMVLSPTYMLMMADSPSCITVDNTVTGICDVAQRNQACTTTVPHTGDNTACSQHIPDNIRFSLGYNCFLLCRYLLCGRNLFRLQISSWQIGRKRCGRL
ncbi:hypothetical protein KIN20_011862 [Parelaphostrongylus tenuis]|uniref:Uncharacterized protein n=1 Tax=Parelaphostrongylus tenuis TaxID=148309 RepID=A0AAD5MEM3_PARTN|nr:hypothetical protein KIN20_011862 [Parelaphostrongylus tenuis]